MNILTRVCVSSKRTPIFQTKPKVYSLSLNENTWESLYIKDLVPMMFVIPFYSRSPIYTISWKNANKPSIDTNLKHQIQQDPLQLQYFHFNVSYMIPKHIKKIIKRKYVPQFCKKFSIEISNVLDETTSTSKCIVFKFFKLCFTITSNEQRNQTSQIF